MLTSCITAPLFILAIAEVRLCLAARHEKHSDRKVVRQQNDRFFSWKGEALRCELFNY